MCFEARWTDGQTRSVRQTETQTDKWTVRDSWTERNTDRWPDRWTDKADRQGGLWLPMSRLQYEGEVLEATPQRDKL